MEHAGLRARKLRETGNWVVTIDCSNALNAVQSTEVLAEVANCVTSLTSGVAKLYGTRSAKVSFRMNSGEARTIACSSWIQQEDPMGPVMIYLAF